MAPFELDGLGAVADDDEGVRTIRGVRLELNDAPVDRLQLQDLRCGGCHAANGIRSRYSRMPAASFASVLARCMHA